MDDMICNNPNDHQFVEICMEKMFTPQVYELFMLPTHCLCDNTLHFKEKVYKKFTWFFSFSFVIA